MKKTKRSLIVDEFKGNALMMAAEIEELRDLVLSLEENIETKDDEIDNLSEEINQLSEK